MECQLSESEKASSLLSTSFASITVILQLQVSADSPNGQHMWTHFSNDLVQSLGIASTNIVVQAKDAGDFEVDRPHRFCAVNPLFQKAFSLHQDDSFACCSFSLCFQ